MDTRIGILRSAAKRLGIVVAMLFGFIGLSATPAAANTVLCSGATYSTCTSIGYTDHGFGSNNATSYWGAYAGHNCTNYVTYVEQNVNAAPYPGNNLGMAYQWAANAAAKGYVVNGTPAPGAVAQWNANTGGASSSGHVAYVESIESDNSITISEDNYSSGPFTWRTISTGASNWPSNFIHFKDLTPSATPGSEQGPGVGSTAFRGTDRLNNGQILRAGEYILSDNVKYVLMMQNDGNLVLYGPGYRALWSSNTENHSGAYLGLQSDGNVVIYYSGGPIWATNTSGALAGLYMQSDGNVVVRSTAGQSMWASGTDQAQSTLALGTDHLNNGQVMRAGEYLRSSDKRYALVMQNDGNLVLYGPGYHSVWASGTVGHTAAYLGLQSDGNIVIYHSGVAIWTTATSGPLATLYVQSDGNVVAYSTSGQPMWASDSAGRI